MIKLWLKRSQGQRGLRRDRLAFSGDFSSDALRKLAQGAIVNKQGLLRLAQHIDESRRNHKSGCVNHALGGGAGKFADGGDAIVTDRKIARDPGVSRTINDPSVLD